jgi:hypothetical protein
MDSGGDGTSPVTRGLVTSSPSRRGGGEKKRELICRLWRSLLRGEEILGEVFVEGVAVGLEVLVVGLDVVGVDGEGDVESVGGDGAEVVLGVEVEEASAGDDEEGGRQAMGVRR